ncbi:hypothetical protein [Shewanella sp.]|uniref:hypothetical protein n=1 Tax=Shewanella sp. TaxID=50422 RepID=UPI0040471ACB
MNKSIFFAALARYVKPNWQGIKHWLQQWSFYRPFHLAYTHWRASHGGLPDWVFLLKHNRSQWQRIQDKQRTSPERVLVATGTAGHLPSITLESLLGVALSVRGAAVDFLLCDGALPACMMCEINWYSDIATFGAKGPSDRCKSCYRPAVDMLEDSAISHLGLGTQISESERKQARFIAMTILRDQIPNYVIDNVPIGEHAMAGTLRFFARGDLEAEPKAEVVLRRYLEAALLTYYACHRLLVGGRYKVVLLNHGIYVPQGIIAETARKLGVRVVTWHPAYRRGCFIFNHGETYHNGLMNEPVSSWEGMIWDKRCKQQIERYLKSRWVGRNDWVKFHQEPEFDIEAVKKETCIDFTLPTVGLLTNVVWDAQLHYKANAFPNMLDWLIKTISYFEKRTDLQLLIRVHPAELTGTLPSRQPAVAEIHRAFPRLPKNVFIIPPESRISTYVAMSQCNTVLIYGTKTGVELTSSGIPVIVAGEAWIRGKGVTLDAESELDYLRLLDALPLPARLDELTRNRALKYAYHFFFRRMIPLDSVQERKGWPPFEVFINGMHDLEPGKSLGLDVICDGILSGAPFIYPAEDKLHATTVEDFQE